MALNLGLRTLSATHHSLTVCSRCTCVPASSISLGAVGGQRSKHPARQPAVTRSMSKRGPLDAYFKRLPTANKKAKGSVHAAEALEQDKSDINKQALLSDQLTSAQDQQQQGQQHTGSTPSATEPLQELKPAGVSSADASTADHKQQTATSPSRTAALGAAGAVVAAASGAAGRGNAFGTLMAAAQSSKSGNAGSSSDKLSAEEMQQQADRNQAAVTAAVQAAAQIQQRPQLRSLLVDPSWLEVLGPEFDKPYMKGLQGFLEQEWSSQTIYPPQDSIFRAFNAVPFDQVRVVILGQDPYINQGEAMGLSFSVPPGIRVPPSLRNIYKELAQDVAASEPKHGCLQKWCSQGVLLLNAALTVRAKSSNSHSGKGWESFTSAALTALAKQRSGILFLLWGKYAQDRCAKLDMKRHHVLKSVHPSPLSAHRGFLGCCHFSQTNELLIKSGQPPIDWQIDKV